MEEPIFNLTLHRARKIFKRIGDDRMFLLYDDEGLAHLLQDIETFVKKNKNVII